jgi:hypothetical protein
MSSTRTPFELQTIQFSRLTRRGVLLGLSISQLIVLACALLIVVTALYTSGGAGLAWSSPAWLTLAAIAWVPVSGRKLIEWAPIITR